MPGPGRAGIDQENSKGHHLFCIGDGLQLDFSFSRPSPLGFKEFAGDNNGDRLKEIAGN